MAVAKICDSHIFSSVWVPLKNGVWRIQTLFVSLPVSEATEESLLTITATTGEILSDAQNDGECVYVALLPARFFATLRMT